VGARAARPIPLSPLSDTSPAQLGLEVSGAATLAAGDLEVVWDLGSAPMGIVLLGPPGAGKGTQATRLADELGLANVSTGQILRANVAAGTPLGRSAQGYMDAGDLVPDQLVSEMVFDRLSSPDCQGGYLLDGFPRTVPQARSLDGWLEGNGLPIGAALSFAVTEAELLTRLNRRATEQRRSDDSEETVRHRLEVFARSTRPLLDYYAARDLLVPVDAIGTTAEVTSRVMGALATATARAASSA
jgi:adenylate kinase